MEYIIRNNKSLLKTLKEVYFHRHLFVVFAWRDLKLKYRQTLIGFSWVILQPLVMMGIFTLVFARRMEGAMSEIPYPVYVFASLMIYNIFSSCVSSGSNSIINHGHVIKKTYFPRIILPASTIIISFVDFTASLIILSILSFAMGLSLQFFNFVFYVYMAFLSVSIPALGFGILFAGLNVSYRDVNFITPFFLQIMLFVSPIIYPAHTIQNQLLKIIIMFNPISAAIEFQKMALQPNYIPDLNIIAASLGTSVLVLVVSVLVFNKLEKYFTDIL